LKDGFSHYNIVGNNCEDFATYCKTGQRSMESAQFSEALERVAVARRAVANGYRSPLVYAGCVMGLFTSNDFNSPPVNRIPSTSCLESEEESRADEDGEESRSKDGGKSESKEIEDKAENVADNNAATSVDANNGNTTTNNNNNNNNNNSNNNNNNSNNKQDDRTNDSNTKSNSVNPSDSILVNSTNNYGNTMTTKSSGTNKGSSGIGGSRKKVNFNIPDSKAS